MAAEYDGLVSYVTIEGGYESPRFRAHIVRNDTPHGARWAPGFDRATAAEVVKWTNDVNAGLQDDGAPIAAWDGDAVVLTYVTGKDETGKPTTHVDRYEADANGLYWIGQNVWEWEDVTEEK
jgi:hypothetical protein